MKYERLKFSLVIGFALLSVVGFSQDSTSAGADEAALAKASQNPLAAMYSLPFQNNTNYGVGKFERTQNVLNVQPVIPVTLKKFNIINRIIVPIITQPSSLEDQSTTGLAIFPIPLGFLLPRHPKLHGALDLQCKYRPIRRWMNLALESLE